MEAEAGISVRWGITPNISLNAAINPDFSQVEADFAQLDVNERFALAFPEKRPFFLEGADFFTTPLNAVFTRTVSDPRYGLKLTGKEGDNSFGAFLTEDSVNNILIPGRETSRSVFLDDTVRDSVLRYRRDIGSTSSLGVLYAGAGRLRLREPGLRVRRQHPAAGFRHDPFPGPAVADRLPRRDRPGDPPARRPVLGRHRDRRVRP